jgi:hypothetical protein
VTAPYDHEALWAKAKVFLNRAMDPGPGRSFDEQALWASAALELLAKAALARVSPLLIAEPTEEGLNILIATGLVQGSAQFTSVSASTVFKRCERAFKPFSAAEAMKFAAARNEYLHGSGIGFMAIPPQAWWPRYWSLAATLLTAQDRDAIDLVGIDRLSVVEEHLARNARNIEHRTEALIERARQRLAQYRAGTLPARIQAEWQSGSDVFSDAPATRRKCARPAARREPSRARADSSCPSSTTTTLRTVPRSGPRRGSRFPSRVSAARHATWS